MGKASSLTTKKALRQSKKAQARNKANRTRLKTAVKRFRAEAESEAEAKKMMPKTQSEIDKAVRRGVIHKNAAARYKSRLVRLSRAEKAE